MAAKVAMGEVLWPVMAVVGATVAVAQVAKEVMEVGEVIVQQEEEEMGVTEVAALRAEGEEVKAVMAPPETGTGVGMAPQAVDDKEKR
jgi:3-deoxy-D-manno-octulosonate 8-phosphate phosphatase KdsC-like HAD superfamily phosphatase